MFPLIGLDGHGALGKYGGDFEKQYLLHEVIKWCCSQLLPDPTPVFHGPGSGFNTNFRDNFARFHTHGKVSQLTGAWLCSQGPPRANSYTQI